MGTGRLCVLLVVLVSVKMMAAQPTFGTQWWCDTFCDDDSDDDDDYDDIFGSLFDVCAGCGSRPTTAAPTQQPLSIMIPPANGLNLTMSNTGSSWLMNLVPWAAMAPPKTTAAGATTAAPTTAAAAGNGTTAAPTKAKP